MAISPAKVIDDFMKKGFFSEYLPPCFNFDSKNIDIFKKELSQKFDIIEPYKYTMSRFTDDNKRRTIYIPEICSYINCVKFMRDNGIVDELIEISSKSNFSFSKLIRDDGKITRYDIDYLENEHIEFEHESIESVDNGDIFQSTFIPNIISKINRSKGAIGILYLDISNFYGSIYAHILPSIPLGYEEAIRQYKAHLANQLDPSISDAYKKYLKLDENIRKLNCGRTNGLLVGLLLSQFIAEALLSRIDIELNNQGIRFSRYADDYEVFIYDNSEIDKISIQFSNILSKYHLSLNNEKTKFTGFPYYITENLEKLFKEKEKLKDEEIVDLFNTFFQLEKNGTKGSVRFLIKSLFTAAHHNTSDVFTSLIINTLVNDRRSLTKVCELIIKFKKSINITEEHQRIFLNLLRNHIKSNNDLEVIWLLYIIKNTGNSELETDIIDSILKSDNDLAIIMLLHEYSHKIDSNHFNIILQRSRSWLLMYELVFLGNITINNFCQSTGISKNKAYYSWLKRNNFSFYKTDSYYTDEYDHYQMRLGNMLQELGGQSRTTSGIGPLCPPSQRTSNFQRLWTSIKFLWEK